MKQRKTLPEHETQILQAQQKSELAKTSYDMLSLGLRIKITSDLRAAVITTVLLERVCC